MTRLGGPRIPTRAGGIPAPAHLFGGPYDGQVRDVKLTPKPPASLTFVASEVIGRRPAFAFYRYELDRSKLGVLGYTYADPTPATDEENPDA